MNIDAHLKDVLVTERMTDGGHDVLVIRWEGERYVLLKWDLWRELQNEFAICRQDLQDSMMELEALHSPP